jgi:thioredoxin
MFFYGKIIAMVVLLVFLPLLSCGKAKQDSEKDSPAQSGEVGSTVHMIASEDEFNKIVEGSGDRLLAFDLYANWCFPCRKLAPLLEKIALEHSSQVTFFKINVDKLPGVAQSFGVDGIPHVAFIKKKAAVGTIIGMQPEEAYVDIINRNSAK